MKRTLLSIAAVLIISQSGCEKSGPKKTSDTVLPRIAIAGLAIESSTFSPAVTGKEAFHARRGAEVFSYYPFLAADSLNRKRADWFPALRGHALPGGIVKWEAYESLMAEIVDSLKKNLP